MDTHDSHEKIFPADPRVTAYAFGELEGDELKQVEAAVAADPELQAAVAELRGFGGQLAAALGEELATAEPVGAKQPSQPAPKKRRARMIPFPLHYLATAAAACFAVVVGVRWVNQPDAAQKRMIPEPAMAPFESPLQSDLDHRVQVARKAAAVPMTASPVSNARIFAEADNALSMPPMADLPSVGASSLGGSGFGKGTSQVGTGVGYATGKGTGGAGFVSLQASATPPPSPPPSEPARLSVRLDTGARSHYVFRESGIAPTGLDAVGGFQDASLDVSNEAYSLPGDNTYRSVGEEPLSTFSIDVDTASYSNVRRFLMSGRLPPRDAVRIEELINYFPYRYAPPSGGAPFAAHLATEHAPWNPRHLVVRIALKGREFTAATRPPANLVFLIDASGSMNSANKLPLVKESLRLLVERLRPDDRVAIVTYAGGAGLALPSTPASRKQEILASLNTLSAGGSTNGAMGIHLAYDIAKANFVSGGGINRVILCTDGDFNVGVTNQGDLVRLIEEKAKSRVFLSIFGFGMGNFKDATLEALSGKGNGNYGYIDSRREAEKVFVEQVEGTLATIAKDVKIQVEFNPAKVSSYRLIGYENRMLKKEDFNNDAVDAGDIGAGHTVTALYEVVPTGAEEAGADGRPEVDPLKYGRKKKKDAAGAIAPSAELLTVKLRYKEPEGDVSKKLEFPLTDDGAKFTTQRDTEFRFAMAVAAWGMLLRDSPHKGSATYEQVLSWAEDGLGEDAGGHRAEFMELVRRSEGAAR